MIEKIDPSLLLYLKKLMNNFFYQWFWEMSVKNLNNQGFRKIVHFNLEQNQKLTKIRRESLDIIFFLAFYPF